MYYCSSCGESGDGRFCRMCGTALSPVTGPAQTQAQQTQAQAPQYHAAAATQVLGPGPVGPGQFGPPAPAGPGPEYDSLFRSDDGTHRATDRTQLLPPTPPVSVDYRMMPPGTSALPSYESPAPLPHQAPGAAPSQGSGRHGGGGRRDDWESQDDESEAPRKGVIYGTLGAVGVAIAVIAALLYFGTPGPASNPNSANAQISAPAAQGSSGNLGQLQLPSGEPVPTTTPPPVETTPPPPAHTTAPAQKGGGSTLPLSMGSTGSLVKYVQERLHQLGFYSGPDNSQFDQSTAVGVQRFQSSAGVQGDPASVVGRSTMTALVAAGSQPELRPGSNGDSSDVKRLQQALNYAENAGLQVNGKYDATTWTAVIRYQTGVGLAPNGQVTPATWSKLQSGTLAR